MMGLFNFQPTKFGRRKTTFRHKRAPLWALLIVTLGINSARASEIAVPEKQGHPPQEDIIYIPQVEWPAVLKKTTEGIFVPYKEYQDLYRRARAAYDKKIIEQEVPGDIQGPVIIEAAYSATVREDVLNFTAEYRIIQHIDEPRILTLPLNGVRVQQARVNDTEAHVFGQTKNLQAVVIPGAGTHRL
ncbi:MAG: hypothetical protein K8I00_05785, partial [Candidatus Omnitrophica bacterium]|nr:hypothetical protein [Candidatus Omnitrophota bacterium]